MPGTKLVSRQDAEKVRDAVAELLGVDASELFLADHTHEELPPGSWSLAFEGVGEWPLLVTARKHEDPSLFPPVFLEPIASWCLGIHPQS